VPYSSSNPQKARIKTVGPQNSNSFELYNKQIKTQSYCYTLQIKNLLPGNRNKSFLQISKDIISESDSTQI